jgi:hypothetical protein
MTNPANAQAAQAFCALLIACGALMVGALIWAHLTTPRRRKRR